eukprot:NODE_1315_length_1001_cov_104.494748_g915_i0.p5 GENE.NODE_1315_length_1001_cov_104.494748_g915_i0~~NODE_1315_length_1001_cov_104.494748_g915_i0.p5  ORF type:complete len:66 (+),score=28.32 NODE_1315_length_1001_cov_104.494748_g915_i0:25-198(+)
MGERGLALYADEKLQEAFSCWEVQEHADGPTRCLLNRTRQHLQGTLPWSKVHKLDSK